jgi:hypothetical protein
MFNKKLINSENLKLLNWQPITIHNIIDFEINDLVYLNSNSETIMRIVNINYELDDIQTSVTINNELILNTFKPCCLQLYSDVCFKRYKRSETVICLN